MCESVNTLRPRQNGRQYPDDNFACISLYKNIFSLTFVPMGPINKVGPDNGLAPARRQAIIWTNAGKFIDAYMRHSASMSWGVPSMMLVTNVWCMMYCQLFRNGATIPYVIYDWEGIGLAQLEVTDSEGHESTLRVTLNLLINNIGLDECNTRSSIWFIVLCL